MNKKLLAVCTLLFLLINFQNADAQNLPSSGDKTIELMIAPFSSSPISFNEFRFRMFRSQDMALRARGDIYYTSDRMDEDNKDTEFYIALAPGIEWHVLQDERYSVYYGAELELALRTSRQHRGDETNKNMNGDDYFGFALNALAGIDFHFLERLYTGIELGYGLSFRSYRDAEVNGNVIENDASDFYLGRFASSRFRLGFRF